LQFKINAFTVNKKVNSSSPLTNYDLYKNYLSARALTKTTNGCSRTRSSVGIALAAVETNCSIYVLRCMYVLHTDCARIHANAICCQMVVDAYRFICRQCVIDAWLKIYQTATGAGMRPVTHFPKLRSSARSRPKVHAARRLDCTDP
jgi:hypothetical protein